MKVICFLCGRDVDTQKDEYISISEEDGQFPNNEKSLRKHFNCTDAKSTNKTTE